MRRTEALKIITEALCRLIPGAVPDRVTITVTETLPVAGDGEAPQASGEHTWAGSPAAVAARVHTALTTPQSPLAQAEDAKRRRDLAGEFGALTAAGAALESAPWYPVRSGDLVHVHYEPVAGLPGFGETYIVAAAGTPGEGPAGLLSMQFLAHTLPDSYDADEEGLGAFAVEAADDPLWELWFEAGPHRLTIVRDGRPVHLGGEGR
ncbi:hypothetical protein AB0M23_32505 [Streptomyces sp. NPDC052077]|uniref:hypothetical protein n=1 Tax=Streptomyces sp. NPDC052077 TaxID=3154757 RepID=UPI00341EC8E9